MHMALKNVDGAMHFIYSHKYNTNSAEDYGLHCMGCIAWVASHGLPGMGCIAWVALHKFLFEGGDHGYAPV